ncbi:hypothetical protein ABIF03_000488 [Bradyrhizobium elkanii]
MGDTSTISGRSEPREFLDPSSLGLAAAAVAIRAGHITSEAYTAALLLRARTLAELNAFITIDETAVLAAARDADKARAAGSAALLLGVPLGVKDSYLTKGLPTSLGLDSLARFVPREDADAVRAIKGAGALVFGKEQPRRDVLRLDRSQRTLRPSEESARTRSRCGRLLERLRRIGGCKPCSRVVGR